MPGQVEFQPIDLSDIDSIADVARETTEEIRTSLRIGQQCSRVGLDGVLATMQQTDIGIEIFRTNLSWGLITLTKFIMRSMLSKGEAAVSFNVSSIVASTGFHGLSGVRRDQSRSRGLHPFALSREAGKRNITVNCEVAPGYMETEMMAGLPSEKLESLRDDGRRSVYLSRNTWRRRFRIC